MYAIEYIMKLDSEVSLQVSHGTNPFSLYHLDIDDSAFDRKAEWSWLMLIRQYKLALTKKLWLVFDNCEQLHEDLLYNIYVITKSKQVVLAKR